MKFGFENKVQYLLFANLLLSAGLYILLSMPEPVYAEKTQINKHRQRASLKNEPQSIDRNKARFLLYFGDKQTPASGEHLSTNKALSKLSESALITLNKSYEELSRIFRNSPQKQVNLRFLPEEIFHEKTNSPQWTSAMFIGGEITIPISKNEIFDEDDLKRAIRHEYVHAVMAEMSGEKCPAWFDEGIAQLIEGEPNPILGPALRNWISNNEALRLSQLNSGFTLLNSAIVPVAYAQSLFAVRKLVNKYGMSAVKIYLTELNNGAVESEAFRHAFKISQREFQKQLTADIKSWAQSDQLNP